MTDYEFQELVAYVSRNIDHDLDRHAYKLMGQHYPLLPELSANIDELAEEWCNDHGIDPDEYYSQYDAEDVFLDDYYDFDA